MISNFLEVSMIEVHFQLPHCKNLQCKQPDNNLAVSTPITNVYISLRSNVNNNSFQRSYLTKLESVRI